MKVAIVGAGKLGLSVTEALMGGGYEVILIDQDSELLQKLSNQLDLLTVEGNAKDVDLLKSANIHTYDFLVAITNNDEKNMVICSLAKKLGCSKVIARIRDPEYVNQLDFIKEAMNIDYIVNPDLSIAKEIYKYLVEKYTLTDGYFSTGLISVIEFTADRLPSIIGKKIQEVGKMLDNMLVVAISRNGKIIIPRGNTEVEEDDYLYVIGNDETVLKLKDRVHERERYTDLEKVMIAGGGKIGFYLAKQLADFNIYVKIIEVDKARCEYLSEHLDNVMILHGDATDLQLLEDENFDEMDAFVSVTGFDEENLLLALIANHKNIEDVVAKVSRKSYADLIEQMGISMALNPLDMTATEILRFIQGSKHILFSKIIQGQAEFVEIVATKNMHLTDCPISELKLPEGIIIAAIHRGDEAIIPQGSTVIEEGDKVIILFLLSQLPKLEKYFQPRKWGFIS
ncbi:MAG: Trk system potassium transporter TrkA [Bacillota bacterium]|jgi:trk system potassium uptake protein TrkA|nr:Trk system potassium transporter TrkA [Bacillota bacterium]NLM07741.1 Trk system potassium transporter TrkA [Clostridiales Family XIII bacterium]